MARRQHVFGTSDDKSTSGQILSGLGSLRDLMMINPPGVSDDLGIPGTGTTDAHGACLSQRRRRNGFAGRILQDTTRRTVDVGMDVQITLAQMALHQELILLGVATADDNVAVGGDEPIEFLEPGLLSRFADGADILNLLQLVARFGLGSVHGFADRELGFFAFDGDRFLLRIVHSHVGMGGDVDVDRHLFRSSHDVLVGGILIPQRIDAVAEQQGDLPMRQV